MAEQVPPPLTGNALASFGLPRPSATVRALQWPCPWRFDTPALLEEAFAPLTYRNCSWDTTMYPICWYSRGSVTAPSSRSTDDVLRHCCVPWLLLCRESIAVLPPLVIQIRQ